MWDQWLQDSGILIFVCNKAIISRINHGLYIFFDWRYLSTLRPEMRWREEPGSNTILYWATWLLNMPDLKHKHDLGLKSNPSLNEKQTVDRYGMGKVDVGNKTIWMIWSPFQSILDQSGSTMRLDIRWSHPSLIIIWNLISQPESTEHKD